MKETEEISYRNLTIPELREELAILKESLESSKYLRNSSNKLVSDISEFTIPKLEKKIEEVKSRARFKGQEIF